jgi:hypothetical protein
MAAGLGSAGSMWQLLLQQQMEGATPEWRMSRALASWLLCGLVRLFMHGAESGAGPGAAGIAPCSRHSLA